MAGEAGLQKGTKMIVDTKELLEMLHNLDAALKMQSVTANPNHAFIGPSVAELAANKIELLAQEVEQLQRESMELQINEAEVQKINLQPGDVLIVKVKSDEITQASMNGLSEGLKDIFPNNKVVVLATESTGQIDLTIASQSEYPEKVEVKQDCSTVNYCNSCSCGKKEAFERSQK